MLINEERLTKDIFYYPKVMYLLQLITVKSSFSKASKQATLKKNKNISEGKRELKLIE